MCTISNPSVLGKGWRELQAEREESRPGKCRESRCCGLALESLGTGCQCHQGPGMARTPGGQATEPLQHQTPRTFHGWDGHGDPKSSMATSRGPRAALLEGPFYGGTAYQGLHSRQASKEVLRAGNWRERLTIRVQAHEHSLHNSSSGQGRLAGMSGGRGQPCWPGTAPHYACGARLFPFHDGRDTRGHPAVTVRSHRKALRV